MKLHELKEARAKKVTELRTINDAANGNELPAEQRARFDTLETEVRSIDERIARETRLAEFERTAATGTPINDNGNDNFATVERRASLQRAIAIASGMAAFDGAEKEVHDELERRNGRKFQGVGVSSAVFLVPRNVEQRVIVSSTTGAGLIATEHRPDQYIDALRANLVTARLGATVLSGLQGNVSIPKNAANRSGQWIAENSALTPVDGDFDAVTMGPKHVGSLVEYTRNLLLQSSPDIETLIRNDFAAALAVALDSAALQGGASNQPDGIITRLTDASAMGTLSDASWEQVLAFIAGVELANAATGRLGWALNPNAVKTMRAKPKVVYGSPETRDAGAGFVMDAPDSLAGYVAASTTSMPGSGSPAAGSAIFGDFSSLLIGYWSGIDILANPYGTGFDKGNVQVRGLLTADVAVRHIQSFQAATDIPA